MSKSFSIFDNSPSLTFSCIISSASKILKYNHFDFQIFVSPVLTAVVIIVFIVIIIISTIIIIKIIIIIIRIEINAPFINWNLAIKF